MQELTAPRKPGEGPGETERWGLLARAASSALQPRRWALAASGGWSRPGAPREPPLLLPAGLGPPRLRQHLELDNFRHPSSICLEAGIAWYCSPFRCTFQMYILRRYTLLNKVRHGNPELHAQT